MFFGVGRPRQSASSTRATYDLAAPLLIIYSLANRFDVSANHYASVVPDHTLSAIRGFFDAA
jgi:hypothetical protein